MLLRTARNTAGRSELVIQLGPTVCTSQIYLYKNTRKYPYARQKGEKTEKRNENISAGETGQKKNFIFDEVSEETNQRGISCENKRKKGRAKQEVNAEKEQPVNVCMKHGEAKTGEETLAGRTL